MSKIIRGISKNARFWLIDSTALVQNAQNIHNMSPTAIAAFGRLLTAGAIMGTNLKGEDLLTLRIDSEGPIKQMVVTATSSGDVKGYVAYPEEDLPLKENGHPDVAGLIGAGTLRVIKDMGLRNADPYMGISDLQTGEIAEDLAYYYFTSEQTPTVIALGVSINKDMSVKSAGGYMIQLMPDSDDAFIDKLEEKIKNIRTITELLEGGMDPLRIAKLIYEDINSENHDDLIEKYKILEENTVNYKCDCNKDKFYKGLITLGKDEINHILEHDHQIEAECHFCKTKYVFIEEDFKEITNS